MTYESSTLMTASEPGKVADDLNDVVRPALLGMGAQEVMAAEAMTGPVGIFVLSTRWESLEAWAGAQAAMAAGMAPGAPMEELANRYQPQRRILSQELAAAGTAQGGFVTTTRYSVSGPLDDLDHAAAITVSGGANGVRALSVLAGAEMTGHLIGVSFMDSPDVYPGISAAAQADARFRNGIAAAGAAVQSRTVYRVI